MGTKGRFLTTFGLSLCFCITMADGSFIGLGGGGWTDITFSDVSWFGFLFRPDDETLMRRSENVLGFSAVGWQLISIEICLPRRGLTDPESTDRACDSDSMDFARKFQIIVSPGRS